MSKKLLPILGIVLTALIVAESPSGLRGWVTSTGTCDPNAMPIFVMTHATSWGIAAVFWMVWRHVMRKHMK